MFKGVPAIHMKKWNKIHDLFFGENHYGKSIENVIKAINLCSRCDHPIAQWLSEVFNDYVDQLKTYADVRNVLLRLSDNGKALYFLSRFEYDLLEKSLKLGFTYAKVRLSNFDIVRLPNFDYTDLISIASDGDRMANRLLFKYLKEIFYFTCECADKQKLIDHLKICIKLGCIDSTIYYASHLTKCDDLLRCILYGKIVKRSPQSLVLNLTYTSFEESPIQLKFVYGRYLKGHIDSNLNEIHRVCVLNNEIHRVCVLNRKTIHLAQSLVEDYDKLLKESIKSIDAWSLCAKHYLGVCKDIRLLIARLLWYEAYEWTNSLDGL